MALDLNKVAAFQAASKAKQSGAFENAIYFKPKDGSNKIRIVPDWDQTGPYEGTFWREVHQHWKVSPDQKGPILCNRLTPHLEGSSECPICEFIDSLRKQKGDPEAQALAKELRAQQSFLIPIVDLMDPVYTVRDVQAFLERTGSTEAPFEPGQTKVQVFAASAKVHGSIVDLIIQNNMDITDLGAGRDIFLKKTPAKGQNDFTRYEVSPSLNPTKAPFTLDSIKVPNLYQLTRVFDSNETRQLLAAGPAGDFSLLKAENAASKPKAIAQSKKAAVEEDNLPASYLGTDADDDSDADDLDAEMRAALKG